jgi:ATP-dependent RNA helicase DeaD
MTSSTPTNPSPAPDTHADGRPHEIPSGIPHPLHPAPGAEPGDPVKASDIFATDITFAELGLRNSVLKGIEELGFKYPTTIQAKLIPVILTGKDVLGQAKTGTGKTAAFGLPLLHMITRGISTQALILVPTRELAMQVATDMTNFASATPIKTSAVFGGERVQAQAQRLKQLPEIIVATPGRIMDMVERRLISYENIKHVVLDEVDRMLDIGFRDDIRRILRACPANRQTVFVSATISSEIEALARSHARDAEKVIASSGALTVSLVRQFHLTVAPWDKRRLLAHLLTHEEPELTVVFCRMKKTVDDVAEYLHKKGIDVHAMHGDMYQTQRNKVMGKLRDGSLAVLIASDLASRGLDVEGISHVINYDLPEDPDIYVHRVGRTARAGRKGVAWSFVTPADGQLLTQIETLINLEIPKLDYPDFEPGPVPRHVLDAQAADAKRAEVAQQYNRFAATTAPKLPPVAAKIDDTKFPGGVVPTKLPPKRMFGKAKTSRSVKAEVQSNLQQNSTPPPAPPPQN